MTVRRRPPGAISASTGHGVECPSVDATRGAAMKSVSIMWAAGVSEDEAQTVVGTVRDLLRVVYDICLKSGVVLGPTAIRPFGTWVIPSIPSGDPYSGTHWYVDTAYDRTLGQVVGTRFLELVKREPWQSANPHFDVAVLDRDLTDGPEKSASGFVLASSLPGTATVISVHRLREIADEHERKAALRRLVIHSFGHVLDVPAPSRTEAVSTDGRERHCTNACVMRHAASPEELVALAGEERETGVLLCPECRRDVLRAAMIQRVTKN
jgi:hypothetical protein